MNHEQRMRDYYNTYNSENPTALRGFYADDVVLVSAQGETSGADAIIGVYQYLTAQFLDQMTPTAISINGDTAIVDITDRFTAKVDVADFMGVALKKGESVELKLRGTYTLVNDRFQHIVIEQRT
jgi:ketosteroid isomerase-like protein